jgi:hypothetical protein
MEWRSEDSVALDHSLTHSLTGLSHRTNSSHAAYPVRYEGQACRGGGQRHSFEVGRVRHWLSERVTEKDISTGSSAATGRPLHVRIGDSGCSKSGLSPPGQRITK